MHHEHGSIGSKQLDLVEQEKAIARHLQLEQYHVKGMTVQEPPGFSGVLDLLRKKAHCKRYLRTGSTSRYVLIDDKEVQLAGARRRRRKVCHV
jgi:hypothetical protein